MKRRSDVWKGNDLETQQRAIRLRMLNPLKGSPRRKPRDPDAFKALVLATIAHVQRDQRFERLGPRRWRLR